MNANPVLTRFISTRSYDSRDYDIDANFLVNKLCHFNCHYCFYRDDVEHPGVGNLDVRDIATFFDGTGLRWHLAISGGEPFVRKDFVEMCELLTKNHLISVNSNLTSSRIRRFSQVIAPDAVDFINASVHIEERECKDSMAIFLSNFKLLKDAGFRIGASYVLTPECFSRYERDRAFFAEHEIYLDPKYLSGFVNGKFYPRDYTAAQRALFKVWSMESEEILLRQGTPSRFDRMINGHEYARRSLDGAPDYSGANCAAGRLFVSIDEDGSIFRCGKKNKIGDIKTGELNLYKEDRLCDNNACAYFCYAFSHATEAGREMQFQFKRLTPIQFLKRVIPRSVKNDIKRAIGTIRRVGHHD